MGVSARKDTAFLDIRNGREGFFQCTEKMQCVVCSLTYVTLNFVKVWITFGLYIIKKLIKIVISRRNWKKSKTLTK